jgi:hypothetical protein
MLYCSGEPISIESAAPAARGSVPASGSLRYTPRAGRIFFVLSDFRDLRDEHEQLAWQGKQHRRLWSDWERPRVLKWWPAHCTQYY